MRTYTEGHAVERGPDHCATQPLAKEPLALDICNGGGISREKHRLA